MPAKKMYRKRAAAKKLIKKRTKRTNVPDRASLSETRTVVASGGNIVNTLYSLMNTSLDQFTRAPLVAQGYQHYRIKNISMKFKPPFDSFVSGTTVGFSKPYLYHMIDKSGAIPTNITLEGLKQMGAKPRALDERPLLVSWAPAVLQQELTSGGGAPTSQGAAYKISPWLNTSNISVSSPWNPSTVDHLGVYWYLEAQANGQPPTFYYEIDVEVQFEFKKPLITRSVSSTHAIAVQLAVENDSSDGIVGGPDGR